MSKAERSNTRKKQVILKKRLFIVVIALFVVTVGYILVNEIQDNMRTTWIVSSGNLIEDAVLKKEEEGYNRIHPHLPIPLLVNSNNPIPSEGVSYDLVKLGGVVPLNEYGFQVDASLLEPLVQMYDAAKKDGAAGYNVTSAYRSQQDQQRLYDETEDKSYVQKPGYSEHQTGLAVDLAAPSMNLKNSPQAKWLYANSYIYGFIVRYPEGKEDITGISFEPWHFRYVGPEIAKYIYDEGITLEEYVEMANAKKDFTKKSAA